MALPAPLGQVGLLDLPDEVTTRILLIVEDAQEALRSPPVEIMRWNELLPLREVCRGLRQAVDRAATYLYIDLPNDWFHGYLDRPWGEPADEESDEEPNDGAGEDEDDSDVDSPQSRRNARPEAHTLRLEKLRQMCRRWPRLCFLFVNYDGEADTFEGVVQALAEGCPNLRHLRLELPIWKGLGEDFHPLRHLYPRTFEHPQAPALAGLRDHIHRLSSFEHLEALVLRAEHLHLDGFPSLPRLRKLSLRGVHRFTLRTQPALEELELQTDDKEGSRLDLDCRGNCTRLRRLDLAGHNRRMEVAPLTLPRSLEFLKLASLNWPSPLDLGVDLPSLSGLFLLVDGSPGLNVRGLSVLLSKGTLRQLCLTKVWSPTQASDWAGLASQTGLTTLNIDACHMDGLLDLPALRSLTDLRLSRNSLSLLGVAELSALTTLHLLECPSLENLPGLSRLKALKDLCVTGCPQLRALEDIAGLDNLQSIRLVSLDSIPRLRISGCPGIRQLTTSELWYMDSLESLEVLDLQGLEELGICEGHTGICFRSLKTMRVARCPALTRLSLVGARNLESLELEGLSLPSMPRFPYGCQVVRLTDVAFANPYLHMMKATRLEPLQTVELDHCTALKELCFGGPPAARGAHPGVATGDRGGANGGAGGRTHGVVSVFSKSLKLNQTPSASARGRGNSGATSSAGGVVGAGASASVCGLGNVKSLTFSGLPSLAGLTLPASLQSLRLSSCPELESLQLGTVSDLRLLEVRDMPKLRVVECPGSVRSLSILSCLEVRTVSAESPPELEMLRLQYLPSLSRVDFVWPPGNVQVTACPKLKTLH